MVQSLYYPADDPSLFMPEAFPVFNSYHDDGNCFGGIPINEHDGLLKVISLCQSLTHLLVCIMYR